MLDDVRVKHIYQEINNIIFINRVILSYLAHVG